MLILEVALGVLIGFILILFLPSIVELFVLLIAYGLPVLFLLTIFLLVLGFSFFLYVSIGFYSVFILGALSFISCMLIRRFQEDFSKINSFISNSLFYNFYHIYFDSIVYVG